jgi:hypothetical protein
VELTYSRVATVHGLLNEMLAMVGRDVLQPARVSPKMKRRGFLPNFPQPSLGSLTASRL